MCECVNVLVCECVSGGFYLFTFWSSKQTEPINLPDNRCLTIGLRVQRYDYFFSFDNTGEFYCKDITLSIYILISFADKIIFCIDGQWQEKYIFKGLIRYFEALLSCFSEYGHPRNALISIFSIVEGRQTFFRLEQPSNV